MLVQAISPFPTMFSTLSKTEMINFVTFNLSSAKALNLVWSKILLYGVGLTDWNNFPRSFQDLHVVDLKSRTLYIAVTCICLSWVCMRKVCFESLFLGSGKLKFSFRNVKEVPRLSKIAKKHY